MAFEVKANGYNMEYEKYLRLQICGQWLVKCDFRGVTSLRRIYLS